MATYTSNYNWTKPALNDPVDIAVLNGNLDSQDNIIHEGFSALANVDNDIYEVMGQMGAKNLIPYPFYETSTTYRGVEWTDNKDGTVTATRVSAGTGVSGFKCTGNVFETASELKAGNYTISGCPSGGSDSKYRITVFKYTDSTNTKIATDYGNGATFTITEADNCTYGIFCDVSRDYSASNLTFKPMLRLATDTDDTYQPYAKTNKQLTDDINAITPHILPDVPSSDGDYSLKLSIADGVPTYSWESVTP